MAKRALLFLGNIVFALARLNAKFFSVIGKIAADTYTEYKKKEAADSGDDDK